MLFSVEAVKSSVVENKYPRMVCSSITGSIYLQLGDLNQQGLVLMQGPRSGHIAGMMCYLPSDVTPLAAGSVVTLTQE